MRLTKKLGAAGALILAALVGGTLIGSTLATDETTDPDPVTGASAHCDTFMDALAAELGTSRDELTAAGQAAANATIDAALAAGDIDEDRAEALRKHIAEADGTGCAWFGHGVGMGFERGAARGFMGAGVLDAAADALGIESAELFDQLRDGGSLEAIAEASGTSYDELKASILTAVQAELDTAVQDGLSQERADAVLERLTAWLDEGGELGGLHTGRGHFGPGHGGFGPWTDHDTSDTDAEESGA